MEELTNWKDEGSMNQSKNDEGVQMVCPTCKEPISTLVEFRRHGYRHIQETHVHQYVIPVAWVEWPTRQLDGETVPAMRRVTKLRCQCGAETER